MLHTNSSTSLGNRFFVFFLLYFVQGIPYGFQTRYLPILFRMNGMELAQVGLFKLLMAPWVFKPVLAGLVDNYFTRKVWLNISLMILSLLCIIASFITPNVISNLAVVMFLFNMATSVQDIALDSVMIESLSPMQLAQGNIAQVVGYKSGGLFSGGVFSILSGIVSWENIFLTLAGTYILGLVVSLLFLPEENRDSTEITASGSGSDVDTGFPVDVKCYLSSLIRTDGTLWIVLFVMFYKLGEIGVTNMFPMFLLDKGISSHMTGFWTAFIGQASSLCGSILGGLIDPRHLYSNLKIHILLRSISILFTFLGIVLWDYSGSLSYVISVICLQAVFMTGGAATTITYTLAMTLSQMATARCRASHYTIITTSDVLGRLLFAPVVAGATQWFGYSIAFSLFSVTSFLVLLHLSYAPRIIKRQ